MSQGGKEIDEIFMRASCYHTLVIYFENTRHRTYLNESCSQYGHPVVVATWVLPVGVGVGVERGDRIHLEKRGSRDGMIKWCWQQAQFPGRSCDDVISDDNPLSGHTSAWRSLASLV